MEFNEMLTIPIVYFMVHSNRRALVARNEVTIASYFVYMFYTGPQSKLVHWYNNCAIHSLKKKTVS